MPVPETLPTVAFDQSGIYRLQIALLVFYGTLLLVTPAYSGLAWGRLPTEISTRGARFAEEADESAKVNEKQFEELKRTTGHLTEKLESASFELEQLREAPRGDNTPPTVGSKE
ncbi:MAG TPA: hypothetical protein VNM41_01135 [Solirubrobacterales bacterium]|nr:hypothetical protein [Solirubrobacterales bacterium]